MQWNTFKADIGGRKATVWTDKSRYRGVCGTIIGKRGEATKGLGFVTIRFANGAVSDEPFEDVALGDNSRRTIASVK